MTSGAFSPNPDSDRTEGLSKRGEGAAQPRRGEAPLRRAPALLLGLLPLVPLLSLVACNDDPITTPPPDEGATVREVGVVVNSVDLSLTLFPTDSPRVTSTVGLGADGSPVGLSARGELAAVPMGIVPAVAVVNLAEGRLLRTIPLPEGSGATGSAFADDSIVVVANPNRNTVSPVNVLRGTVGEEIPVGTFPQTIVPRDSELWVLNSELGPDFLPAGPGTITILSRSELTELATIELSGENPGGGALGPDGRMHVVNSGSFGGGNGSLSVIDAVAREEVAHHMGFGDFPGPPAFGPSDLLFVPSFSFGLALWDPSTASFSRGPDDALAPGGIPSVSGIAFDSEGRLYTLLPRCDQPGAALRLDVSLEVTEEIPTGTCPVAITFTSLGP